MGDFGTAATSQDIENAIGLLDKRIEEMKVFIYYNKTFMQRIYVICVSSCNFFIV